METFSGPLEIFGFMIDLKKHKNIISSDFLFWSANPTNLNLRVFAKAEFLYVCSSDQYIHEGISYKE